MIESAVNQAEWVGYAAMLMVLISFMMKDFRKLRFVNSVGALLFVVYGFLLQISWPIVITNLAIVGVNCYYLFFRKN
ncbi:MAG: uroporphyrinogen decarboxylase [Flavobacteriaceae bacterium]|nr:uroporphyrinogen decarboxylase [Bacteroidia bacterium]MBT8288585.1 uroporphyrinogen decarboxylase [Bacteroidia bacterium]NNF76146.1 uroporphyrinogen decarboxylase [Flavobacteriaceae bacterium]NNK72936.1 uroporphyrinogen decarboxylase [Flavobacteriaceae bacterium]